MLTLGEMKTGGTAELINLCTTSADYVTAINRAISWLLIHGNWWGTTQVVRLPVVTNCFRTPSCVSALLGVRNCNRAATIHGEFHNWLPNWDPRDDYGWDLSFEPDGTTVLQEEFSTPKILRIYPGSTTDVGKTIRFFGYDKNNAWVRTATAGVFQDGELVTLESPFVDTVTEWSNITGRIKDLTDQRVQVFAYTAGDVTLTPVATYEYWETSGVFQRYKVHQPNAIVRGTIDCKVKIEFQAARHDSDFLRIGNRPALELALQALKAKDDGDLARADVLFFGNAQQKRLGAIPLLQQELRTYTDDRIAANVQVHGSANFRRVMAGFN